MALARKNSRWLVVGDVAYRWTVRRRPTYAQGITDSPLGFAVELAEHPAGRLLVSLAVARPDNWLEAASGVVTPALVAPCIQDARIAGWDPARRGPALRVTLPASRAHGTEQSGAVIGARPAGGTSGGADH
jgi:hypothetical protein